MMDLLMFAARMGVVQHELALHREHAMEHAAVMVEEEAKSAIGTYKYDWEPLAQSTLEQKGADTPLLETGEMRDSIEHQTKHGHLTSEADVGTDSPIAVYQEFGTAKIPPRPFMGMALGEKEDEIAEMFNGIFEKSFKV